MEVFMTPVGQQVQEINQNDSQQAPFSVLGKIFWLNH
jgi:hypothetical protein